MMEGKLSLKGLFLLVCLLIFSVPTVFAQVTCTEDSDCEDDNLYCNGNEICEGSVCTHSGDPCPPDYECELVDSSLTDGACVVDPPVTYKFDFDGDEAWDTEWCLGMGETVDVDVWIVDYSLDANMLGSAFYFDFQLTPNVQVNFGSSYIYDLAHGGPWYLTNFQDVGGGTRWGLLGINWWVGGVTIIDDKVKMAVIQLERIAGGDVQIETDDGLAFDVDGRFFIPDDAVATIKDCSSLDDQCNMGVCDPGTGDCIQDSTSYNGDPCDDGVLCTIDDTCNNGACSGTGKDCSSLDDQCNVGICDTGTGNCIQDSTPYNGNSCDDGSVGTLNDTCSDGVCTGNIGAASIPTLSEWGMIIFMTIIVGISVVVLSRRRMV